MKLQREQIVAGVNAGLALTDPETDLLETFRKHAGGILILRSLLEGLATGNLALGPGQQPEGEPSVPPGANRKTRRKAAAKKRSKKVAKKKAPAKKK